MNHKRGKAKSSRAGCLFPECSRSHLARGWCSGHYKQVASGRDPTPLKVHLPVVPRIWTRVAKGAGNACWLWQGATNDRGYGLIGAGKKGQLAYVHVAVWESQHGPVPKGYEVCHKCDNPPCVRHLFLGTHAENMVDMARKRRSGMRKLTVAQVLKIRAAKVRGSSHLDLAVKFGVSKSSIKDIVSRRHYDWVSNGAS
jgi:hypothetical protein